MTITLDPPKTEALPLAALLALEGQVVYGVLLDHCHRPAGDAEPYLIFGPQHRVYGLDLVPPLEEYGEIWIAFPAWPSARQLAAFGNLSECLTAAAPGARRGKLCEFTTALP